MHLHRNFVNARLFIKIIHTIDRHMLSFNFLQKVLEIISQHFFKENVALVIFYKLTKSQCLIAFTSRDNG